MVLQAAISFIYGAVQSSWIVAAVAVKYVLILQAVYAYRREGDFFENLGSEIQDQSREVVSGIVLLGVIFSLVEIDISTILPVLSYAIAAVYFGYLFWEF